jgi:SHS2 domain-containing protein
MAFALPHAGGSRHMSTPATRWRHFAHGADIGVHGEGDSPAAAFAQAAFALAAITTPPDGVTPQREVEIQCAAPDLELLLVDWLNALITAAATEHLVFGRFAVAIAGDAAHGWRLTGRAGGEPIDRHRHQLGVEAKGATMTALAVRQQDDGTWWAECVIDV